MKITNEVILEKINNIHEDIKEMKPDVKLNTEFRLQAKGVIGIVSFTCTVFGGFLLWIYQRVGGK